MKVKWRRSALGDLTRIHDYIAQDNPTAARTVAQRVLGSVNRLAVFPDSGRPGLTPGTREIVVVGLPYVVVYDHDGASVDIIAVFHAAQSRS